MQSLSKIAILVVLVVIFFALLTQRMIITNDNMNITSDIFAFLYDSKTAEGTGEKLAPRTKHLKHDLTSGARHGNTTSHIHAHHKDRNNSYMHRNRHHDHNQVKAVDSKDIQHHTVIETPKSETKPTIIENTAKPTSTAIVIPVNIIQKQHSVKVSQHANQANKTASHPPPKQNAQPHVKKKHAISRLLEPTQYGYHPNISPRIGTDISPQHHDMLIRCRNQTKCIVPDLQLQVKLKVYFCRKPVRSGARFYYLVKEGLMNHPNIELVSHDDIESTDLIVYLPASAPWHLTECSNKSFASKLLVLEEFDGHSAYVPYNTIEEAISVYGKELNWYFTYFKRSFVSRSNGLFMNYPHLHRPHFYPLVYSLAEMYISDNFNTQREIDILCTLRGHKGMRTRLRASEWVQGYYNQSIERGKPLNVVLGQADTGTRVDVSKLYFQNMYNTKIIVTVNPSEWEGDFRLWESLASGALVFVDPVFVPHEYPIIHGVHVIYFDNLNKQDLWTKLDYYLQHPQEARKIAVAGYLFAMKHHRTVSMIDYFMRTSHKRLCTEYPEKYGRFIPGTYKYSGQYLHREASAQLRRIKENNYPGNYTTGL